MAENLTDWQKIAAVYRKAMADPEIMGESVDIAIGVGIAGIVKKDDNVIVASTGAAKKVDDGFNYQLQIMKYEGNHYFVIFPDRETAAASGAGYVDCCLSELLGLVLRTPQMRGLQLLIDFDEKKKMPIFGEINEKMVAIALNT